MEPRSFMEPGSFIEPAGGGQVRRDAVRAHLMSMSGADAGEVDAFLDVVLRQNDGLARFLAEIDRGIGLVELSRDRKPSEETGRSGLRNGRDMESGSAPARSPPIAGLALQLENIERDIEILLEQASEARDPAGILRVRMRARAMAKAVSGILSKSA